MTIFNYFSQNSILLCSDWTPTHVTSTVHMKHSGVNSGRDHLNSWRKWIPDHVALAQSMDCLMFDIRSHMFSTRGLNTKCFSGTVFKEVKFVLK